jgi:hypothetical protein
LVSNVTVGSIGVYDYGAMNAAAGVVGVVSGTSSGLGNATVQVTASAVSIGPVRASGFGVVVAAIGLATISPCLAASIDVTHAAVVVDSLFSKDVYTVDASVVGGVGVAAPASTWVAVADVKVTDSLVAAGNISSAASLVAVGAVGVAAHTTNAHPRVVTVVVERASVSCPGVVSANGLRAVGGIGITGSTTFTTQRLTVTATDVSLTVGKMRGKFADSQPAVVGGIGAIIYNAITVGIDVAVFNTTLVVDAVTATAAVGAVGVASTGSESHATTIVVVDSSLAVTAVSPPSGVGAAVGLIGFAAFDAGYIWDTAIQVINSTAAIGAVASSVVTGAVGMAAVGTTLQSGVSLTVTGANMTVDKVSNGALNMLRAAVAVVGVSLAGCPPATPLGHVSMIATDVVATSVSVQSASNLYAHVGAVGVAASSSCGLASVAVDVIAAALRCGFTNTTEPSSLGPSAVVGAIGAALYANSPVTALTIAASDAVITTGGIDSLRSVAAVVGAVGLAAALNSPVNATAVQVANVTAHVGLTRVALPLNSGTPPFVHATVGGFGMAYHSGSEVTGAANVSVQNVSLSAFVPSVLDPLVAVGGIGVACADSLIPTLMDIVAASAVVSVQAPQPNNTSATRALSVVGGIGAAVYSATTGSTVTVARLNVSNATVAVFGNWTAPTSLTVQTAVGAVGVAHGLAGSQLRNCTIVVEDSNVAVNSVVASQSSVGAIGLSALRLTRVGAANITAREVKAIVAAGVHFEAGPTTAVGLVGASLNSVTGRGAITVDNMSREWTICRAAPSARSWPALQLVQSAPPFSTPQWPMET